MRVSGEVFGSQVLLVLESLPIKRVNNTLERRKLCKFSWGRRCMFASGWSATMSSCTGSGNHDTYETRLQGRQADFLARPRVPR